MKKYDVVIIGDSFEDIFIFPDEAIISQNRASKTGKTISFPYGSKINADKLEFYVGGSAANAAVNFANLDLSVGVITAFGDDSQGQRIQEKFDQKYIDSSMVIKTKDAKSNLSVVLSYGGERTIITYHAVEDYSVLKPKKNTNTRCYYLAPIGDGFDQISKRLVENMAKKSCGLVWNPGKKQIANHTSHHLPLLRMTTALIVNKEEAIEFIDYPTGSSIDDLLKSLQKLGPKIVVITDGKNGAFAFDGQNFYKIPPTPDETVDATGAGDAFGSTFCYALLKIAGENNLFKTEFKSSEIAWAMKLAIAMSGSVVTEVGAQTGLLSISKLDEKFDSLFKIETGVY